jgi:hypothetical protein
MWAMRSSNGGFGGDRVSGVSMHSPIVADLPANAVFNVLNPPARSPPPLALPQRGPVSLFSIVNRTIQPLRHRHTLFLLSPGIWQAAGECRRGEACRGGAVHDGRDDPR